MATAKQEPSRDADDFVDKVVSAVSEAFNNVAIHAYRDLTPGTVDLEMEVSPQGITIRMSDTGHKFEPKLERTPDLKSLPESHMGLYIVRSFMDQVMYRPGNGTSVPNTLTLVKNFVAES
jgi:serine/threonine-protein kinase RsbW